MTGRALLPIIGRQIELRDARTGICYAASIVDATRQYGKLRVTCNGSIWFEPTEKELEIRNNEIQTGI